MRPAHAVTVLRVLPPDRVDRTVRSGRRARSPWLRCASSARQAAPAGASQRRRPSVRRAAVSEVTVGPDGEALVRSGSFSRWMAGAGPGADVPGPCRRAAWTPGGERLVQACPVPVGRGDGPVGQPSPVSAGLGGGSSTVRAGAVVLADRASRPAASATGRHLPSTSGGRRGERAQRAADERGQRVRRGLGPEHGVGQRRPTRRIRAGSPASSRSRCRSGPEPAVRAGPASRTAMTRGPDAAARPGGVRAPAGNVSTTPRGRSTSRGLHDHGPGRPKASGGVPRRGSGRGGVGLQRSDIPAGPAPTTRTSGGGVT